MVKIITEKLQVNLNMADLDKVHRFGRSINGQPRPIIAKCFSLLVRDRIFQNVKKLVNTGITMREDLPEDVRSQRSNIRSLVLHARQLGHNTNVKGDSAHIDGHVYRHQDLDTLPRELSLAAATTVSTQNTICFQGKHNPLSNFYESQIVNADGHVCNSQFIVGVSDNTSDYYSNFAFQESGKNSQEEMLMVFNIRSIPRNLDCFVSEFNDVMQNNMNVICFTETWFNKDNVDVYKLCNYNGTHVFRTGKKGGGVSIFVRNRINYTRLNEFCYNENYLERVAIHIKVHEMNTAKNIILINMYRPPKAKLEQYMTTLEQMLEGISLRNEYIFIVGDFNIDLLNSGSDIHSTRLINLLLTYDLKPMITCPTRVNKNKDTLLDNIFTNFNEHNRTGVILNNISDHYPIFLSLGSSCGTSQQPKETTVNIWNYNINTISKYSRHIEEIELTLHYS